MLEHSPAPHLAIYFTMAASSVQTSHEDNTHSYDKMKDAFAERTAEDCATHLLPHLKPHYRILDVGCGPGSITVGLARYVPQGSVVGVDVNEGTHCLCSLMATRN